MRRWARPRADERGETLAEVLVTISILGILFVAVLGAIGISAQTSDINRKEATDETLLRTAAEQIQNASYVDCASTSSYPVSQPSGYTVSVTAVKLWNGSPSAAFSTPGSCTAPDSGVQSIDLRAQSNDGRAVETLTIYKRTS